MLALQHILKEYKEKIDQSIKEEIPLLGPKSSLRDAMEYALLTEGKRFRPAVVLMLADALGNRYCPLEAALSIEFFHTASLIADDLPCMDDDAKRRDQPALHVAFGETIALLASYALISLGYQKIEQASQKMGGTVCQLALENATKNTGILGATYGQYLDLFLEAPTEKAVLEIIEKKTGTLFEISFVFGWLFGGGDVALLDEVKKLANHFGRAFQITDDFLDLAQDRTKQCPVNYPLVVGEEKARKILQSELDALFSGLRKLDLKNCCIEQLALWLKQAVENPSWKTQ